MDRATFKLVMAIGVLLNSALYLGGCLIAGLATQNGIAWRFALAALGITYFSYVCHFAASEWNELGRLAIIFVWLSVLLGACAGVALLFG